MVPDSVPDSFLIHSSTEIVYADPVFSALVGADSTEELVGSSLTDLVPAESRGALSDQVARIENEDASVLGLRVDLQTRTGQTEPAILVSSLATWDGTQRVQTLVFPAVDPDSPAGRLLRDQAMDEAPIGITISDPSQPDNPLIYVNDGFCELTGYPRDEILGQNCRFLQGEATREEPVAEMRAAIEAQTPVTVELRNYRKDGSMFWNRVTISPIRSESGAVTNYLGYQQDITAEKRYEQNLSLFREQADESDNAIFVTDPDGTIQYVNPAFERITGYSATEALGQTPRILKSGHQDEAFYAELWEQITAGEVWEADLTNQTKDGELYEVRQKIIPITDEDGNVTQFVAVEEDTTDEVLRRQAFNALNRVLRHNLRNRLNVIEGHTERLAAESLDAEAHQAAVETIHNHARSLRKIADKTAEVRALWYPMRDDREWGLLNIEALVETYRRSYPAAEITTNIAAEGEIRIRNVELFELALGEAVENAITHTTESPPEVVISIERASEANQVRISVADNGPGIPEHERAVIESGAETPLNHGLGVGFWLMEWIAKTLGGNLVISEAQPKGSVVTFELPHAV